MGSKEKGYGNRIVALVVRLLEPSRFAPGVDDLDGPVPLEGLGVSGQTGSVPAVVTGELRAQHQQGEQRCHNRARQSVA